MRRYARYLILILGIPACDSPTEIVVPERTEQLPALAAARSLVDPGTLIPEPPNAVCWRVGGGTICHTQLSFPSVNEPIGLELACGTVYQTGSEESAWSRISTGREERSSGGRIVYWLHRRWGLSPKAAGRASRSIIRFHFPR